MLSEKMEKAINDQINAELYSSYLYLSMAAYFADIGLPGFNNWLKVQALEELYHAMKFFDYVSGRGGKPVLEAVDKPPAKWESPIAAVENILEHEKKVTGLINNLVDVAIKESDHATNNFLQWYVAEQVEEEESAEELVQKLKLAGEQGNGLLMIDRELAARPFKVPADISIPLMNQAGGA
ncbi:MAG: ferritin [bacterium]